MENNGMNLFFEIDQNNIKMKIRHNKIKKNVKSFNDLIHKYYDIVLTNTLTRANYILLSLKRCRSLLTE